MFVGDKQNFLRNNSSAGGRRVAGLPKHGERKRRSPNGTACAGGASVKKNDEEVPERQEPGQSSMEDQRNLCTSRRYICWPEQSLGFESVKAWNSGDPLKAFSTDGEMNRVLEMRTDGLQRKLAPRSP